MFHLTVREVGRAKFPARQCCYRELEETISPQSLLMFEDASPSSSSSTSFKRKASLCVASVTRGFNLANSRGTTKRFIIGEGYVAENNEPGIS